MIMLVLYNLINIDVISETYLFFLIFVELIFENSY